MPSLVVTSRNTVDSQILRKTAQDLGWVTLRLDGSTIPDWFEPPDQNIALYATAPLAFDLARQLERTLLACTADWTVTLPAQFLHRRLRQQTLQEALKISDSAFVKHAVGKAFPAGIYGAPELAEVTNKIPSFALVHVGEVVTWLCEYRCFIRDRRVVACSLYRRPGMDFEDHSRPLVAPKDEIENALQFAGLFLKSTVPCPPAFVLDVGLIENRSWAVIEFNECWASGIYGCDPKSVLDSLLAACPPTRTLPPTDHCWDFEKIYSSACGNEP